MRRTDTLKVFPLLPTPITRQEEFFHPSGIKRVTQPWGQVPRDLLRLSRAYLLKYREKSKYNLSHFEICLPYKLESSDYIVIKA
jgi:hypothetical protein